jgi:hypothetical protein
MASSPDDYTYLVKFDKDLNVIWVSYISGNSLGFTEYFGYDFIETENGEVVVVGIDRPVSVLYYEFTQGPIALVKINATGTIIDNCIFKDPYFRAANSIAYSNGSIYLLSSRILPNATQTTKLTVHKLSKDLDTIYNKDIVLWPNQKLDGSFLQKRENGWFIGALELQGYEANEMTQKPFLINLDENFNVQSKRRFGSSKVFGFTKIIKRKENAYSLVYSDYIQDAVHYGYDIVIEKIDENGKIVN